MHHIVAVTQADDEHAPSSFHRGYRKQFPFEEDLFPTILKLNHVPVLMIEFVSLDHRSRVPPRAGEWKPLAHRVANGESWLFRGHTPPRRIAIEEKTLKEVGVRPWAVASTESK